MKKSRALIFAVSLGASWAFAQHQPAAALRNAYEIRAGGMARKFEVAFDEVSLKDSAGRRRVRKVAARDGVAALQAIRSERAKSGGDVSLVLYERGKIRSEFTRAHVTSRILVRLGNGIRAADVASSAGLLLVDSPAYAPGLSVLEAATAEDALAAMEKLRAMTGVLSADVLLARQKQKSEIVNDEHYPEQWNLHNAGQLGGALWVDLNVEPAWSSGFNGSGITIGILDDGIQHAHPDLQPNYAAALSWDFNSVPNDGDPTPIAADPHGTACAGLAAARGNNSLGISGVAYQAGLAGIRIVAAPTTDQQEADAFSWHNDGIQVKSSSWNVINDGSTVEGPGPLAKAALIDGVTNGRGGKGTIYLVSGGNGLVNQDNSNYDGYANAIQVIAVGAVSDLGFRSFYSEPGANLAVSAPSNGGLQSASMTTTDLMGADGFNDDLTAGVSDLADANYTSMFGGSSAACPQVAGVVALILQANPNLGWRDVKEILMKSARPIHASDPDWQTNGSGFRFNHKYGAGLVDAGAAVTLAQGWTNLPAETTALLSNSTSSAIPDNSATGVTRTFNFTNTNFRVEHVEVTVDITHTNRGDLEVILTSPSGTTSRLAELHADYNSDYVNWTFTTVHHWGENALGNWTVKVADRDPGSTGTLNSVVVTLHGASNAAARIAGTTAALVSESNLPANTAADPGETVTFNLGLKNIGGTNSLSDFTATLLPVGGISNPSAAQTFGILTAGGAAVTKSFTFQANGSCGTMVNATLLLQQNGGATQLGYATIAIPLGKATTSQSPLGGAITIVDNAIGSPSPSSVTVSGLTGRVQNLTVLISSLTHAYPDDVGLLLDGPSELQMQIFRGGPSGVHTNVSYTLDGNAPVYLPSFGTVPTGTYKPYDQYPSTRPMTQDPGDPEALTLGEFNGVPANGVWKLFTQDFDPGSAGSIGGWRLTFTTMDCTDNVLFASSTAAVDEDAGLCPIVVRRTGGKEGTATVHYATANGTATAGSDYTDTSGDLTFLTGELEKTISVPITDDFLTEGAETFTVTLSAPTGNTQLGSAASKVTTVTISASDPATPVSISPPAITVNEGATATFTVSRSTAGTAGTVNYATAPGAAPAATAGTDYTTTSGTLSFAVGETSKTIDVPVAFDGVSDAGEHFTVTLSSPTSGISLGAATQSIATISDVAPTTVFFSASTTSVDEGATAMLTVNRSGGDTAGTVNYATAAGSASAGSDYTTTSGTLSFAVGETSKTIDVPTLFDAASEPNQTFTVTLSAPTGGVSLGTPATNTVTIVNVSPTTAFFSASTTSVDEGATATLTVNRSGGATAGTVNYATAPGAAPAATAGTDYTTTSGTLSFAVGETSKTIEVPVLFDGVSDTGEHFTVTLSSPTGGVSLGTPATNTVTIVNVAPTTAFFSASTTSVDEGATATLTVNRSGGATAGTVNYATTAGSASAGSDYTTTSGTLSFAVGETSKTIDVPTQADTLVESNETFSVTLSGPTGGVTLGSPATSTVTIVDVTPTPVAISPAPTTADEGTMVTFTVSRSTGATSGTVNYATSNGSASAAAGDYTATSGTLSFAVDELSKTFSVPVSFDNLAEPDEIFFVTLSGPTGGISLGVTTTSTVTINDIPGTPVVISPAPTTVSEGTVITFTISRTTGATPGTVNYSTTAGTATAGSDYTTTSGTLSFAIDELSKTITVPVLFDPAAEPDETFVVGLSNPTGGITVGTPSTCTVTINDVVATPVDISPVSIQVTEGAQATFTVTRASGTTAGTVAYATSNGTAAAGSDFTSTSGILSFAVNELSKTFDVPILSDALDEPYETFTVTLSNPTAGVSLGAATAGTVTISDPPTPVVISPVSTTVAEGTSITFTVTRTSGTTSGTVDFATADGTAIAGNGDYTTASGTLSFAVNELSKTFNVPVLFDAASESNETFTVTLINPTAGIALGAATASTVTVTDVPVTPVAIAPVAELVIEGATANFTVSRASGATAGTVNYATNAGTAASGSDYTAMSGTLSFAVDELSKTLNVPVLTDALDEPYETFTVNLSNPAGGITLGATTTSTVTISDPPTPVVISPATTTVAEGTLITFTVTRTSGTTAGTVDYVTSNGTATSGSDYTAMSGTLNFALDELTRTVNVPVHFDSASESDETFTVTLSNPTAGIALGATTTSTATVTDVPATPLAISPGTATAIEGTTITFTVSRASGATAGTVNYATSNESAFAGSDYTATSGILSFAVNELSKTFEVPVLSDAQDEPYETFAVTLSNPMDGVTLGATTTSTVTISDPPTPVVISPATTTVAEGSQVTLTVSRTSGTTAGSIDYATSNGTATAAEGDYTATSGTLNFAVNELSKTINVPVLFDSASEPNETFTVTLGNPTAGIALGATTTSTITITDLAATSVFISPTTTQVTEGATVTFTVTRASGGNGGTVDYATSNGTAAAGSDYTAVSGTLNFAVNELSKTFDVPVLSDALDESYETFDVTLSNPTGGITLGATTTSTVTISDPPTPVVISPATATVAEGAQVTLTVSRTSGTTAGSVNYATGNGTATAAGGDFTATSGTLNFAVNELSKTINVPVLFDSVSESDETFTVTLSSPAAGIALGATTSSTVTITDLAATPVVISPAATQVTEGATVTFTVSRASGTTAGSVNYATSNGTASAAGGDYTAVSGTLNFAVNELSKTIDVPVLGDALDEPYETFVVTLSNPMGGITLGAATTGTVTISDPPTPVVISPAATQVTEGATVTLTVSRTSGTTAGSVNYATSNGTATAAGGDYTATSGTLDFAVSELSKTINVPVLFDGVSESNETFTVSLSSPAAGIALGATTTSTVTISDLAATPVVISPVATQVTEGATVTLTVSRASGATAGSVNYATSNGTASAAGGDYTAVSGTLNFAVNELSKTIDVPVLGDALDESYETFDVTLSNPTGGITLGATTTSTVTISDPPTPVVISPAAATVAEGATVTLTVSRTSGTTAGSVNYATGNGTATAAGGDYTATSGTLNFAVNELSKTINVPVLFDSVSESDETFTVTLSSPAAGIALGATTSSTVTITDLAATPVVISPVAAQVTEGATVTLTVSRASGATAGSVNYATSNGTASAAGGDYTAVSGTLNFAVNELSKTIDVPVLGDALDEPFETFSVALSNPGGGIALGGTTTSTITINDPPTPVEISPAFPQVAEGDVLTFIVTRATAGTAGSVDFATSDGTAAAGADYTATSGTLSFAINEFSKVFNVPAHFDGVAESDETFTATLSNPSAGISLGATIAKTVAITDVPATPVVISSITTQVAEGSTLIFTVSRASGETAGTVAYATSDETATAAGGDYTATSGTLSFAVDELSKTFSVPVLNDGLSEPSETFAVALSNPGGGIILGATSTSTVTIDNSLTPVEISPDSVLVDEAASQLTFTVSRISGATAGTVAYATSNGSANAGSDYTATSGTLSFAVNELSKSFNVSILNDNAYEPNENLHVSLSDPAGGIALGTVTTSTVTIHDGDADSDGLPDDYETAHGLNPDSPSDAALDSDGDGFTNFEEFIMGTDPQDRTNSLTVVITQNGDDIEITFPTVMGRTYSVQYLNNLMLPSDTLQGGIVGDGNPVTVTDIDASLQPHRFYQVTVQGP